MNHCLLIQYPHLGNPHYLVPPKVHPQNIPTKYISIQKHAILVPLPNPYPHATKPFCYPHHWNLGFDSTHQHSINLTNFMNNIKIILLQDKCSSSQLSYDTI